MSAKPSPPVVLLIQRNDDNRDMYADFLGHQGFSVLPVAAGEDALPVAAKADVIVTGLLRGGAMDGIELIRRLRSEERTRRTPIVVVTASALPNDRTRAETAGCNVFLPMPCLPETLLREIRKVLLARAAPRPVKAETRPARPAGRTPHRKDRA
jgi:two-component system cell cycle response regulator DivK